MSKNCNLICSKELGLDQAKLDKMLGSVGYVTAEFRMDSAKVFVITMGGNPKSTEGRLKDLLFAAGFRNSLLYRVQPEWEMYHKPEGFIRYPFRNVD